MFVQVGKGFNRDKWNELEKHVRHLARKHRNVYICTGPLYLPRKDAVDGHLYVKYRVIGATHVSVPTHFFKCEYCSCWMRWYIYAAILIERDDGQFERETYLMPNEVI